MTKAAFTRTLLSATILTALAFVAVGCCGGGGGAAGPRDPEAAKRRELAQLKDEEARLKAVDDAVKAGDYAVVSLGAAEIEAAANKALPITMNANTLNSHVTGKLTITKMKNVRIVGGKVQLELEGKGKNINVSSAGRAYLGSGKVNDYIKAVQGGMTVKVTGKVSAGSGKIMYAGKATRVTLKKKKNLANDIKGALNGSFFNKPHPIKLGNLVAKGKRLGVRDAFVAGTKVAIVFTP
jgi:hypothetical protein